MHATVSKIQLFVSAAQDVSRTSWVCVSGWRVRATSTLSQVHTVIFTCSHHCTVTLTVVIVSATSFCTD